jgi:hypothetical protein
MKLLLRLIFKILASPIAVPAMLGMIAIAYGFVFVDWLYDNPDALDRKMNLELKGDFIQSFKRWFTTI